MKKRFVRVCLIILLVPFSFALPQYQKNYEAGLKSINDKEIYENILFITSDSLKGRPAGSDENIIAAMFIAQKFKQYGIKPALQSSLNNKSKNGKENTELKLENISQYEDYLQKFVIHRSKLTDNNTFSIITEFKGGSKKVSGIYKDDFYIQYTGQTNLAFTAPVVFIGYGISEGEGGYNDYKDAKGKEINVKDKIVLFVDGYPGEKDSSSSFAKAHNAAYINPLRKAEAAMDKGAIAAVIISSPLEFDPPVAIKYEKNASNYTHTFDHLTELPQKNIPVIYASNTMANSILEESGIELKETLQKIEKNLKPCAVEIPAKKISVEIDYATEMLKTQNVVGILEGTDPKLKDEFVVVGAHYDHIGLGYYYSMDKENAGKIHPGADDNASGTVGLIAVAEAFSKARPKRSIIFIAFSGEENAMQGSRYFVYEQPLKPLDKMVSMVNLDMIGRGDTNIVWAGGTFYSDDIKTIVEKANEKIGFNLLYNVGLLGTASDHAPFINRKIPALFFFSGFHDDYHTINDIAAKINIKKIENVAKLAFLSGSIIAEEDKAPNFRNLSQKEKEKLVKESIELEKTLKKN